MLTKPHARCYSYTYIYFSPVWALLLRGGYSLFGQV